MAKPQLVPLPASSLKPAPAVPVKMTLAPPSQIQDLWRYGSYCDSTLSEHAIIVQTKNTLIQDPVKFQQTRGWAVGLAPWSETPLAVEFQVGLNAKDGQQKATGVPQIIRPGEILRPTGLKGSFSGIRYGLPYGWLGGGATTLLIFKTSDSVVDWNSTNKEVMFHQFRIPLVQSTDVNPVPLLRKNWPLRFPWANAFAGATLIPANGRQFINVTPTRTVFRLRVDNLAVNLPVRLVMRDITDLDVGSDGLTTGADITMTEFTFQSNSYGYAGAGFPTFIMDDNQIGALFGSQEGGISLLTQQALTGVLAEAMIDVCRYGTL